MSSEIEGIGLIVALPALAALGAGWLLFQAGAALVGANSAITAGIEAEKRREQEAERQRKMMALAGREKLVQLCESMIAELDASGDAAEAEKMKFELKQICSESMPDDAGRIESLNSMGFMKLERITSRQSRLKSIQVGGPGMYDGYSVADLMDDLRIAFSAAQITRTIGANVEAADPVVLERAALNGRLSDVAGRVMTALEFVVDLAENYGVSQANNAWFQSCFNGVDGKISALCSPVVSNADLKKGIRSLEDMMEQYDMLHPSLEEEKNKIASLYSVYADAAGKLGEPVYQIRHFKSATALEAEIARLKDRAEKARECAEIYKKLGPAAYMCYAWDQELKAMGYSVRTRKKITEMANYRPERARLGENEMPAYQWDEDSVTQFYSIAPHCDLQLIVHPDGSTTMQTISREEEESAVAETKSHCDSMKEIHRRLFENWFISYDYRETEPAEHVQSVAAWRSSADNKWVSEELGIDTGIRTTARTENKQVMHQK